MASNKYLIPVLLFQPGERIPSVWPDGTIQFYHTDHLGSTCIVTDQNGEKKEWNEYFPFGTYRVSVDYGSTFPDVFYTFTGQEEDDDLGLYNYIARLYDPVLGRFISPDPKLLDLNPGMQYFNNPQNLNVYSYVWNNPINAKDPSGMAADTVLDIGFILFDIYTIYREGFTWQNSVALGLDIVGAAVPFVTGLGPAYKTASRTERYLAEVATEATKINVVGKADNVAGILMHTEAKNIIRRTAPESFELATEVSYKAGWANKYGAGSKRLDVVEGVLENPMRIYDFKFGEAGLTDRRILQIREAVGNLSIPVIEIRPLASSFYIPCGVGAAYNFFDNLTTYRYNFDFTYRPIDSSPPETEFFLNSVSTGGW